MKEHEGVIRGRRPALMLITIFLLALLLALPAFAQTGGISGFVVDNVGNAISGATVRATSGPSSGMEAVSASDGSYRLTGLAAGGTTFVAHRDGFTDDTRTFTVVSDVTASLDFTLTSQLSQGGVLQGVITRRDTGTVLSNVEVDLSGPAGAHLTTETGSNGAYRFAGLVTATYTISASRTGFVSRQMRVSVTANRVTTANLSLTVNTSQFGSVQGTVTSSAGGVIPGVTVSLQNGASAGLTATTNRNGVFQINRVIPDLYTVAASASGFQSTNQVNVDVIARQKSTVDFTLTPLGPSTASVDGFVTDTNGLVLQGARVAIVAGPVLGRSSVTDATGHYLISNVPGGTYSLQATVTGFLAQTVQVVLTAGQTSRQDFLLAQNQQQSGGTISGQVTNGNSVPLSAVAVSVVAGPSTGENDTTDANGNYAIANLPNGTYSVKFSRAGFATQTIANVNVVSGQTTVLNAQLAATSAGGTLTGLVRDTGGVLLGGVTITVIQGTTTVTSGQTDTNGRYTLTGIAAGTYNVRFDDTGFDTLIVSNVRIQDGVSTVLNEQLTASTTSGTGTVTGTVRDQSGRAAPNISVELIGTGVDRTTTTASDGTFEFDNVPAGSGYTVTISGTGIVTDSQGPFAVTSGQTVSLTFTLRVESGSSGIAGVVRASNGLPISGATVKIIRGPLVGLTVRTGADGRYNFVGVPAGTYTLQATATGFRSTTVSVVVRAGGASFRDIILIR